MDISSEQTIRAFIAIDPGPAVRDELLRLQEHLRRKLAGSPFKIKWVVPEAMHLTLFFLGALSNETLAEVSQTLKEAVPTFPEFKMSLSAAGCFGKPHSPRVIWVGLDAPSVLFRLQAELASRLSGLGMAVDDRPFRPHLTLGRVRAGRGDQVFHQLKKTEVDPIGSTVSSLELMKSELTPEGPVYTRLLSVPLAG